MPDAIQLVSIGEDCYYQDPVGFFARLRESRPVAAAWTPDYGRAWIITRYAGARTALTDPRLANNVHHWPGGGRSRPSEPAGQHKHLLNSDQPDRTRLRRLLDEMAAAPGDVIDLINRHAFPLPATMICELLARHPTGGPRVDRGYRDRLRQGRGVPAGDRRAARLLRGPDRGQARRVRR